MVGADNQIVEIDLSDSRQLAALALAQQRQIAIEVANAPETANKVLISILHSQSTVLMMLAALHLERAAQQETSAIVTAPTMRGIRA